MATTMGLATSVPMAPCLALLHACGLGHALGPLGAVAATAAPPAWARVSLFASPRSAVQVGRVTHRLSSPLIASHSLCWLVCYLYCTNKIVVENIR